MKPACSPPSAPAVSALALTLLLALPSVGFGQGAGAVVVEAKLGAGFGVTGLDPDDTLGSGVGALGDLDGNGTPDLAVGAPGDDDGGLNRGAVYILFLRPGGSIESQTKLSSLSGGFSGALSNVDMFGAQTASLGDLDNDGTSDLAVTAPFDDDGASGAGAVWILFLKSDGTVKAEQKISLTEGGFSESLDTFDFDVASLVGLGDLDGDGVEDLAWGAGGDDDGGLNHGAVYIIFLNANGTVKATQKISGLAGGFTGVLDDNDRFGSALAAVADMDGDGVAELAVGASGDDDGANNQGAVWMLFMNANGTVKSSRKISGTQGGFGGSLVNFDGFGGCVAALGDVDGDGTRDLAVGAPGDDDGGPEFGALWILFLNPDASVKAEQKISALSGSFTGPLSRSDGFGGFGCARTTNILTAGGIGVAVGTPGDDGLSGLSSSRLRSHQFGADTGAVWLLSLSVSGPTTTTTTTTAPSTTTTTLPGDCGDANGGGITATDALLALQTAVGAAACPDCVCDTNSSGAVTATDALQILQTAVGVPVQIGCPPCG